MVAAEQALLLEEGDGVRDGRRADPQPLAELGGDEGAGVGEVEGGQILCTQVGATVPDATRAYLDFWTTLYQLVDEGAAAVTAGGHG